MATTTSLAQRTTCPNYIAGGWLTSSSSKLVERRNPANHDDLVGLVARSTREEMRQAIESASGALPAWRETPAPVRGKMLFRAARLLEEQKEDVARVLTREEGKTISEALGEIARSFNILEFIAGEGRRLTGETLPSELPKNFAYTLRLPLGVVGLITPWNFPVAIPVWKMAPALVCGNAVVWKPAEITSFTARRLLEIFIAAGIPPGVLNMVTGSGLEVGDELVSHPSVRAISFTGSTEVGSRIYEKGARQLKRIQCEMGGKNPVVVLADADLELAAASTISGAFGSTGQRCTATSRVVVEESVADRFVEMLAERARKLKVGDGTDRETDVAPAVDESQYRKVLEYIEIGKQEAQVVCGGRALTEGAYDKGYYIAPTIFDHVPASARIAQEEIFGPVLAVIRAKDFDSALDVANSVPFGLTASVFTADANRVFEAVGRMEAGMIHVNSPTVGGEAHVPFGGCKSSGLGEREVGSTAIEFYSELKVVYVDYTGRKRESKFY